MVALACLTGLALIGPGPRAASPGAIAAAGDLAPHRAIYDIRLEKASSGAGITALKGRMVFEISGDACVGYRQGMRLVTQMTDREGQGQVSDLRTTSTEDAEGRRFAFETSTYRDERLSETTEGNAERRADGAQVDVALTKPSPANANCRESVVFPVQHSIELLAAAKAGKALLNARLYDGSETGTKVYDTTAAIGAAREVGSGTFGTAGDGGVLAGLRAWPVSISYYEPSAAVGDGTPAYEMSFLMFENGIARKLMIDYGTFSLNGKLAKLELLPRGACPE